MYIADSCPGQTSAHQDASWVTHAVTVPGDFVLTILGVCGSKVCWSPNSNIYALFFWIFFLSQPYNCMISLRLSLYPLLPGFTLSSVSLIHFYIQPCRISWVCRIKAASVYFQGINTLKGRKEDGWDAGYSGLLPLSKLLSVFLAREVAIWFCCHQWIWRHLIWWHKQQVSWVGLPSLW